MEIGNILTISGVLYQLHSFLCPHSFTYETAAATHQFLHPLVVLNLELHKS